MSKETKKVAFAEINFKRKDDSFFIQFKDEIKTVLFINNLLFKDFTCERTFRNQI